MTRGQDKNINTICRNWALPKKRFQNFKQLQAFHVVFGRAYGATLTTLNAKKIPLSSAFSMLQLALCLLDCAVWEHHLAF